MRISGVSNGKVLDRFDAAGIAGEKKAREVREIQTRKGRKMITNWRANSEIVALALVNAASPQRQAAIDREVLTVQNRDANAVVTMSYTQNGAGIEIDPKGVILRDINCPRGELYFRSTVAGSLIIISEEFFEEVR